MKVASYDPHLLELWRRGAMKEIELKIADTEESPGRNLAIALRQRMYALRKQMEVESHPMWPLAARAMIRLFEEENGYARLIVCPVDSKYIQAIHDAGVRLDDENDPTLDDVNTITYEDIGDDVPTLDDL